jgi:hypothetical protein
MKLVNIGMILGAGLILLPPVLDLKINHWIYYLMCLIGGILCTISGLSAQASSVGMGETGEELLQQAWRWFRIKVLRQKLEPLPQPEPLEPHQSIAPEPPLSMLSKSVQGIGLVLVIAPTLLGWKVGNDTRMAFIAVGSVLIMAARRKLPPTEPNDPPHGQEWLQMVWARVRGVFKDKL